MLSLLPSLVVLGLAALVALVLTRSRRSPPERETEHESAARALAIATAIQALHFSEEAITGFHDRLGATLGTPGMPFSLFVAFNLAWLGIWIVSVPGLRRGGAFPFFAAWFLAIAGMFNGIAHPLLAVAAGGEYFPGLLTSPLIAAAGVLLWIRLWRASVAHTSPSPIMSRNGPRKT